MVSFSSITVYVKLGLNASSKTRLDLASLLARYRLSEKHSFEFVTPTGCQYLQVCGYSALFTIIKIHGGQLYWMTKCDARQTVDVEGCSATARVLALSPTEPLRKLDDLDLRRPAAPSPSPKPPVNTPTHPYIHRLSHLLSTSREAWIA
jgi:hypothetical protein